MNKFIVERKTTYKQTDKYPHIRVNQETYNKLAEIAAESGLPMIEVTVRAVKYAVDNLVYIDQIKE